MSFISSFSIDCIKNNPWPYNVDAVRYAKDIVLDKDITFFIGDNGTGKSTLLETLAYRLQLPLIDGLIAAKSGLDAAIALQPFLTIDWKIERTKGFFFRAEDFSSYVGSVNRADTNLDEQLKKLKKKVPKDVLNMMKESSNYALREMRKIYGQNLESFSHGEAYMKIMHDRVQGDGIYFLDEPEAALSPSRQLELIYFIIGHLKKHSLSQFVIATHSPMLMSIPNAKLYEITEEGMDHVPLDETNHYTVTKSFLNNPELYLRHLDQ